MNQAVKAVVNQNLFDAQVTLVYNIGETAFKQSTLVKAWNAGHYKTVADQFSRWSKGSENKC